MSTVHSIETLNADRPIDRLVSGSESHALVYDESLQYAMPLLDEVFSDVNGRYNSDKLGTFQNLVAHRFQIYPAANGGAVEAATIFDEDTAKSDEELIIFAAYSDIAPESTPEKITEYANRSDKGFLAREMARPHTWNQTTKSAAIHAALKAAGRPMRVTTIYGLIPQTCWTPAELKAFKEGDYSPAGQIAELAFQHTQDLLHGPSTSQSRTNAFHFNGLSVGGSFALAAAADQVQKRNVTSVTSQEQPLDHDGLIDTLKRFTIHGTVGEKSTLVVPERATLIGNTAMRKDVDGAGPEIDMYVRMIRGASKLSYLRGFSHPAPAVECARALTYWGIPTTFAVARNSGMTEHTVAALKSVDNPYKHIITIDALEGQHAAHIINESVPVTTVIALAGIAQSVHRR